VLRRNRAATGHRRENFNTAREGSRGVLPTVSGSRRPANRCPWNANWRS